MLLARLASRRAKPDGQFIISPDTALQHLADTKLTDIPGIGRQKGRMLAKKQLQTCGDLQALSRETLEQMFGGKTGLKLYNYCRGVCDRKIESSRRRQSIGLDVNYGIRFSRDQKKELLLFLDKMCAEVRKEKAPPQ